MTASVEEIIRFVEDKCDQSLDKLEKDILVNEDTKDTIASVVHIGEVKLACQILNFIKSPNKKEQSYE